MNGQGFARWSFSAILAASLSAAQWAGAQTYPWQGMSNPNVLIDYVEPREPYDPRDKDYAKDMAAYQRTMVLYEREKKHQVLREVLGSDVNRLAALFLPIMTTCSGGVMPQSLTKSVMNFFKHCWSCGVIRSVHAVRREIDHRAVAAAARVAVALLGLDHRAQRREVGERVSEHAAHLA